MKEYNNPDPIYCPCNATAPFIYAKVIYHRYYPKGKDTPTPILKITILNNVTNCHFKSYI